MYGKDNIMYDLHDMSESQAATLVERVIRETSAAVTVRARFVTGRGNHINSKGLRGTLFTQFPEWLRKTPYADRIEKVETFDGHYEVYIKPTVLDNSFQAKLRKFSQKFYAEHIDSIRIDADNGNPEAMVLYGQLIESGEYGESDRRITAEYFRRAAEANYPLGMHEYARCWLHGIGVRQSDEKAKEWLTKASKLKFIPSTLTLAKSFAIGLPGYERDLNEAIRLHTICAEAGETDSMRFFGSHFMCGRDVEPNLPLSFSWYMRAAVRDDAKAQFNVAVMFAYGRGTEVDIEKSQYYFKLAAYNGDVDAQFLYAMTLMKSPDKKIKNQGITWLFAAADNGSERANEKLSSLLPPEEAREYLARSAHAGNFFSQRKLNMLNGDPEDSGITLEAVIAKYQILTENDIMHMVEEARYFMLDKILLCGQAKDKRSAFDIINSMARHECTYAMRREAYFYARGDGVFKIKKDHSHVIKILERSSELEDPISMVQLAQHYLTLKKQPNKIEAAKKLLRQAAEKKYPPAFYELGLLYINGSFGANKKPQALQCFQSAVKYEKMKDHVRKFDLGPLDEYEFVEKKAQQYINQLRAAGVVPSKSSRDAPPSMISAGFFKSTGGTATAPVSDQSTREAPEYMPVIESSRQNVSTSIPAAASSNPPQTTENGLWSFFSAPAVVLAVTVAALTTLAFK